MSANTPRIVYRRIIVADPTGDQSAGWDDFGLVGHMLTTARWMCAVEVFGDLNAYCAQDDLRPYTVPSMMAALHALVASGFAEVDIQ